MVPVDSGIDLGGALLLTTAEAASALKVSPRTLEKYRVHGGGPKFVALGSRRLYQPAALLAWINAATFESTSEAGVR